MPAEKNDSKNCGSKKRAMFAYGLIQLSSSVISAIALAIIAFGFCSVKKEAKVFNECFDEMVESGSGKADAVRFCNGG